MEAYEDETEEKNMNASLYSEEIVDKEEMYDGSDPGETFGWSEP